MSETVSYDDLAQKWGVWRADFNRTFLRFAPPDMPLVTLRPDDIAFTTLLGRISVIRRALAEIEVEKRSIENEHAQFRALLVAAIMRSDPEYVDAKNDTQRRAVLDLRLDADDYPMAHPLAGSTLRVGYRRTKDRLAVLKDEECRVAVELTIARDERRMFETLVDFRPERDEQQYEQKHADSEPLENR